VAILIVGLVVFLGVHSLRMVAPGWRDGIVERHGEGAWKGVYSGVALVGFALIIWGFGRAATEAGMVYVPPRTLRHLTFALMLPALVLAVASALPPGHIRRIVRHPLLIGTALWAFAHLLVNGELAAVVLFGAFLAWAVIELAAQAGRFGAPVVTPSATYDLVAVAAGLVLYGVLVWRLHEWAFGVSPVV
jgi:uncharacterized membrane protein